MFLTSPRLLGQRCTALVLSLSLITSSSDITFAAQGHSPHFPSTTLFVTQAINPELTVTAHTTMAGLGEGGKLRVEAGALVTHRPPSTTAEPRISYSDLRSIDSVSDENEATHPTPSLQHLSVPGYVVERFLGHGRFADVYLMRDPVTGHLAALKIPRGGERAAAYQLQQEILALTLLEGGPGILKVWDHQERNGYVDLAEDYIDGPNFLTVIRTWNREGVPAALRLPYVRQIGSDILETLAFVHSKNLVVNDVKPDNMMISKERAVLTDFGSTRQKGEYTQGTPLYTPIAVLRDEESPDQRRDIYALGKVLSVALADREDDLDKPFIPEEILARLRSTGHEGLSAIAAVIEKAIQPDAKDRYHTAAEMLHALTEISAAPTNESLSHPYGTDLILPDTYEAWVVSLRGTWALRRWKLYRALGLKTLQRRMIEKAFSQKLGRAYNVGQSVSEQLTRDEQDTVRYSFGPIFEKKPLLKRETFVRDHGGTAAQQAIRRAAVDFIQTHHWVKDPQEARHVVADFFALLEGVEAADNFLNAVGLDMVSVPLAILRAVEDLGEASLEAVLANPKKGMDVLLHSIYNRVVPGAILTAENEFEMAKAAAQGAPFRVRHSKFGEGIYLRMDGDYEYVEFNEVGLKKLRADIAASTLTPLGLEDREKRFVASNIQSTSDVERSNLRIIAAREADRLLSLWGEPLSSANLKKDPDQVYAEFFEGKYREVRQWAYQASDRDDPNIASITGRPTSSIILMPHMPDWHARASRKLAKSRAFDEKRPVETIYVNAFADPGLIHSLDDYFAHSQFIAACKTAMTLDGWLQRHDSVTIYCFEPITQQVEQDLIHLTRPYIRSSKGLFGRKLADGLYVNASVDPAELNEMIQFAERLDPAMAAALRKRFVRADGRLSTSVGQAAAIRTALGQLESVVRSQRTASHGSPFLPLVAFLLLAWESFGGNHLAFSSPEHHRLLPAIAA